jgi:hypothetical protein
MPRQTLTSHREAAEMLAISALSFLGENSERLGRFLALTGIAPSEFRALARDPAFLAAVLDHVAGNEAQLLEFAATAGCDPADIGRARAILGGPAWERDSA